MMVRRNRRGQTFTEYAIVAVGVIVGVSAMMVYVQRTIQARAHDAADDFVKQTGGSLTQYVP